MRIATRTTRTDISFQHISRCALDTIITEFEPTNVCVGLQNPSAWQQCEGFFWFCFWAVSRSRRSANFGPVQPKL